MILNYSLTDLELFVIIFLFLFTVSLIGLYLIHKIHVLKLEKSDNDGIFVFSCTIGIVWAILLGFVIVTTMNFLQSATDYVQKEADVIAHFYNNINLLKQSSQQLILKKLIKQYTYNTINLEWPAMSRVREDKTNEKILDQLLQNLANYYKENPEQEDLKIQLREMVTQLSEIRVQRFGVAINGFITPTEWSSIIITTLTTIFVSLLLNMRIKMKILNLFLLCTTSSILLTLIISTDAPFLGSSRVSPSPLVIELNKM